MSEQFYEVTIKARGLTPEAALKNAGTLVVLAGAEEWDTGHIARLRTGVSYGELKRQAPATWNELEERGKW